MKKLQITISVLFIFLFGAGNAMAQEIQNGDVPPFGIGIRANPDGAGITAKYFFIPQISFEGMVNASGGTYFGSGPSTTIVGLAEYNLIFNNPSWRAFIGPGGHITSWKQYPEINNYRQTLIGIDGIIGLEYVFYEVPIGISIDVKPAMNFVNGVTAFPENTFGLAVRYYFGGWNKGAMENRDDVESGR